MSEEKKKEGKVKEIRVGETITVTDTVTVIVIRGEANKELDKLPQNVRQEVLNEAVELSKSTTHPYEVTLEEVTEAKKRKGVSS
jgi:hypothetical protein